MQMLTVLCYNWDKDSNSVLLREICREGVILKNIQHRRLFDIIYCVVCILTLIVITILTICNISLPDFLVSRLPAEDTLYVMFQVQVSIAVLPLAIIALITGIMKETIYGVSLIQYVMYSRPIVLTYRRIAITQIGLIMVSFLFMSYQLYNHLELMLLITIANTLIMMVDCFNLISDCNRYKPEIKEYLMASLKPNHFKALSSDTAKMHMVDIDAIEENTKLMNAICISTMENKNLSSVFLTEYSSCMNSLLSNGDSDIFLIVIKRLNELYHQFNQVHHKLNIFGSLYNSFCYGLRYLNLTQGPHPCNCLNTLRNEIFDNSVFQKDKWFTWFTADVYRFASLENVYPSNASSDKNLVAFQLYDWYPAYSEHSSIERIDRVNFFNALIQSKNFEILDEKVYNFSIGDDSDDLTDKLCATLFLYYLALCEPLAEKNLSDFTQSFIQSKQLDIQRLVHNKIDDISKDDLTFSYSIMKNWEIIKSNSFKQIIYKSVVNDFWIFSATATSSAWSVKRLLSLLGHGQEFSLYQHYFADSATADETSQKYKHFCELFGFDFSTSAIDLLRSFLSEIYKNFSIDEAKKEYSTLLNDSNFLKEEKENLKEYCKHYNDYFSVKSADITTIPLCLHYRRFCFELYDSRGSQYLKNYINNCILSIICNTILPATYKQTIGIHDELMPSLRKMKMQKTIDNVNTIMGQKNCFSFTERDIGNKILNEFSDTFLTERNYMSILFLSRELLYIHLDNVSVNLRQYSREELLQEIEKDYPPNQNGTYTHIIANKLTGDFTEEELIEFLQHKFISLEITIDMQYGLSADKIGYSITRQLSNHNQD